MKNFIYPVILLIYSSASAVEYSATCGQEWDWVNPLPQGNQLNAVAWSEEQRQYVAVGDSGAILTSPDGKTWQAQTSGTDNSLEGIHWNGQQWITLGYAGTVLTSPDGSGWQSQTAGIHEELLAIHSNGV